MTSLDEQLSPLNPPPPAPSGERGKVRRGRAGRRGPAAAVPAAAPALGAAGRVDVDQLGAALEQAIAEVALLSASHAQATDERDRSVARANAVEREHAAAVVALASSVDESARLTALVAELRAAATDPGHEVELLAATARVAELSAAVHDAERRAARTSELEAQAESLRDQVGQHEQATARLTQDLAASREALTSLQGRLAAAEETAARNDVDERLVIAQAEANEAQRAKETLAADVARLSGDLAAATAQREHLLGEVERSRTAESQAQERAREASERAELGAATTEEVRARLEEATATAARERAALEDARGRLSSAEQGLARARADNERLRDDAVQATRIIAELRRGTALMTSDLAAERHRVSELAGELVQHTEVLARAQPGTAPITAQAHPDATPALGEEPARRSVRRPVLLGIGTAVAVLAISGALMWAGMPRGLDASIAAPGAGAGQGLEAPDPHRLPLVVPSASSSVIATAASTPPAATSSPTSTPSVTRKPTPSATATPRATATPTPRATSAPTPRPTKKPKATPTAKPSPKPTRKPTPAPTPTKKATGKVTSLRASIVSGTGKATVTVTLESSGPVAVSGTLTIAGRTASLNGPATLDGKGTYTATVTGLDDGKHSWKVKAGGLAHSGSITIY